LACAVACIVVGYIAAASISVAVVVVSIPRIFL
jgi:hypothetical protein